MPSHYSSSRRRRLERGKVRHLFAVRPCEEALDALDLVVCVVPWTGLMTGQSQDSRQSQSRG